MNRKLSIFIKMLGVILWIVSNSRPTRSETVSTGTEGKTSSASESDQTPEALEQEVNKLFQAERYKEVIEKTNIYLTLCKKTERCGSSLENISSALNTLGSARAELGEYAAAAEALEEAYKIDLQLAGDKRGKAWLAASDNLNQLAWIASDKGDYELSLSRNLEVLRMRQEAGPKASDKATESYNNIGDTYIKMGKYHMAQSYLRKAVEYFSRTEPQSIRSAISHNNLADVYSKLARYQEASSLQLSAINIAKSIMNVQSSDMATFYTTLGNIYRAAGAYMLAEQQYIHALEYWSPSAQERSVKAATVHHNLGVVYQYMSTRAKDNNLTQKHQASAKAHLEASLKIREALFRDKPNSDVAYTYDGLATLHKTMGPEHFETAMHYQQTAVRIFSERFAKSPEHPALNGALFHLAQLLEAKALADDPMQAKIDRDDAAGIYGKVLQTRRAQLLDDGHPDVMEARHRLAMMHAAQGKLVEAISELEENLEASEKLLHRVLGGFGETRIVEFLRVLRAQEEEVYSLLQRHRNTPALGRIALQTALLRKGLALEVSAERFRIVQSTPSISPTAVQLRDARADLANLELGAPPASAKRRAWLEERTELRNRIDSLDEQLAHDVGTGGVPTKALAPKTILSQIGDRIPSDGALIDFVAYCPNCVDRIGADWAQLHYLAFLLIPEVHKDGHREPLVEVFDLGSGKEIAHDFERFSIAVSTHPASRGKDDLDPKEWGQRLYQRIMQPIVSRLGDRHKIYLVPDGLFQQMPFIALHDGNHYLVERFQFVYLNSGRELLRDGERSVSQLSVTVLADPEFAASPNQTRGCGGNPGATSLSPESPSNRQVRHFVRSGYKPLESLPGTCQEAKFIEAVWPGARILLGKDATKRALRETVSPGLLHIGTHTAFLGTEPPAAYETARYDDMEMALLVQDPLLQSRLLLSKVNQDDRDDGIATALELSGLNLQGTQLVVLPDCDTALGQISRGEGVYGLRSAILIAGAESLIASLWKVDDATAPEMIASFYTNILQGRTRLEALHLALQSVQRTHLDPYFWGSLVLVGQPGKMRGLAPTPPQIPLLPPPCRTSTSALRWFGLGLFLCGLLAMGLLASRRVLSRAE